MGSGCSADRGDKRIMQARGRKGFQVSDDDDERQCPNGEIEDEPLNSSSSGSDGDSNHSGVYVVSSDGANSKRRKKRPTDFSCSGKTAALVFQINQIQQRTAAAEAANNEQQQSNEEEGEQQQPQDGDPLWPPPQSELIQSMKANEFRVGQLLFRNISATTMRQISGVEVIGGAGAVKPEHFVQTAQNSNENAGGNTLGLSVITALDEDDDGDRHSAYSSCITPAGSTYTKAPPPGMDCRSPYPTSPFGGANHGPFGVGIGSYNSAGGSLPPTPTPTGSRRKFVSGVKLGSANELSGSCHLVTPPGAASATRRSLNSSHTEGTLIPLHRGSGGSSSGNHNSIHQAEVGSNSSHKYAVPSQQQQPRSREHSSHFDSVDTLNLVLASAEETEQQAEMFLRSPQYSSYGGDGSSIRDGTDLIQHQLHNPTTNNGGSAATPTLVAPHFSATSNASSQLCSASSQHQHFVITSSEEVAATS